MARVASYHPMVQLGRVLHAKRIRFTHLEAVRRRLGELDAEAERERRELQRYVAWADTRGRELERQRRRRATQLP